MSALADLLSSFRQAFVIEGEKGADSEGLKIVKDLPALGLGS